MAKNNPEEKEDNLEAKKIMTKKINFFLSNYSNWFIFLVAITIIVFGFFSLLKPKYEQISRYLEIINQQGALDYDSKKAELAKMKDLLNVYNGLDKKNIDKINFIAPVKQNKEELFTEINYLVAKSQLVLLSVALSGPVVYQDRGIFKNATEKNNQAEKIEAVSVNLSISGTDYNTFKTFLDLLENNLRLIDVTSLSFDPKSESTSLTMDVYYLKE
jgi:Tfp pilus assembly protein PilO